MPRPAHDTLPPLCAQLRSLIHEEWEQSVLSRLPADFPSQARTLKAFERARKLTSVSDLLRGLLAYVLCVTSLRELGAWAVLIDLANLSHVAWHQRLRQARDWLLWLLTELLAVPAPPVERGAHRTILIDGTRLREPGGCGDDWRLHLSYDVQAGQLLDVHVSDRHTAESLTLFAVQPADLIVADRGYCQRKQLAYVLRAQGHVVIRLSPSHVPLLDEQAQAFDLLAWLKEREAGQHQCAVSFEYEGQRFAGRLLARSLSEEKAEKARAKARQQASKKQHQLKEETLYLCGWFLLFTSLASQDWSDQQVLQLYRARWQIELFIKQIKQFLVKPVKQLRGRTALTNEAIILALLLAWALVQPQVLSLRQQFPKPVIRREKEETQQEMPETGRAFAEASVNPSPQEDCTQVTLSRWTITSLCVQTLRQHVQGFWPADRFADCWPFLLRYIAHRRRRWHQESDLRRLLLDRLATPTPSSA